MDIWRQRLVAVVAHGRVSIKHRGAQRAPATTGDNWIISHVGFMAGGRTYRDADMTWCLGSAERRWFSERAMRRRRTSRHVTWSLRRPAEGLGRLLEMVLQLLLLRQHGAGWIVLATIKHCVAIVDVVVAAANFSGVNTCRQDRKLIQRRSASRDTGPHAAYVHSTTSDGNREQTTHIVRPSMC